MNTEAKGKQQITRPLIRALLEQLHSIGVDKITAGDREYDLGDGSDRREEAAAALSRDDPLSPRYVRALLWQLKALNVNGILWNTDEAHFGGFSDAPETQDQFERTVEILATQKFM